MKKIIVVGFFLAFIILWTQPGEAKETGIYGKPPLYFVPNEGQFHPEAVFFARTPGYTLWLTPNGMMFDSLRPAYRGKHRLHRHPQLRLES